MKPEYKTVMDTRTTARCADQAAKVLRPKLVVVAFLQNVWHPQPERIHAFIERFGRKVALPRLLFGLGSKTGKVLLEWVGEGLCGHIIWEETSPEVTGTAAGCPKYSLPHMRAVIEEHSPDVVLLFGERARTAWEAMEYPHKAFSYPHPARAPRVALEALRRECVGLAERAGVSPP